VGFRNLSLSGIASWSMVMAMPDAVGIDMTTVHDVRSALDAFGDRYLTRVFTPGELAECGTHPGRLAARFAAKEATIKALQAPDGLPWRTVELRDGESETPSLVLRGAAAARAREGEVTELSVSVSRTRESATAIVFATRR
jgi:holo-[acyl-carrier protein] synthase